MEQFFPGSIDGISDGPKAKAVRNRLAHGYFSVDQGLLWDAVKNDLPSLHSELEDLMNREP